MNGPNSTMLLPKLIVLSAPSGAGKSTLANMLLKNHPSNFELSISYTTRTPRGDEQNGVHYFFISEQDFQSKVKNKDFLEHAFVYGKYWYGTSRSRVESILKQNKSVLFDIDIQGGQEIKKIYQSTCVTIFIHPPSLQELQTRLENRKTDAPEAIAARLKTAKHEIEQASTYDYQLINKEIDKTYLELEKILKSERCLN